MRGSAAFRAAVAPGGALAGPWVKNNLWKEARAVPSLDLRFADNKSLVDATTGQNLITFTRASSGTYVDSRGVIRTATTNLLLRSEEFNNASWTRAGVLPFDSGSTVNAIAAPDGSLTADFITEDTATSTHTLTQGSLNFTSGLVYTISCFIKRATGTRNAAIQLRSASFSGGPRVNLDLTTGATTITGTGATAGSQSYGNGWWRVWIIATATSTVSSFIDIGLLSGTTLSYTGDGTSGIYLWGAQLEQSSTVGEYISTTSTINSAPRFDHSPTTGESLGLLVEEQRTNSIRNNTMVGAVAGTPGTAPTNWLIGGNAGLTYSIVGTGTDNGINYIDIRLFGTTAAVATPESTVLFEGSTSVAAAQNQTWAGSAYVKIVGGSLNGILNGEMFVLESSISGTLTGASSTFFNYSQLTGALPACRVSHVRTLAGATTAYVTNRVDVNFAAGGGSAVDFTLRIGLPQLEQGAFATSVIPTTTAAATRSADVVSITGTNFSSWYRQDEGTVFADATGVSNLSGATRRYVEIRDAGSSERLVLGYSALNNNRFLVVDTNTTVADIIVVSTQTAKVAGTYKFNSFQLASNGTLGTEDNVGTVPTPDQMQIGSQEGSTANTFLNGTIRRLTYWPRRLSNETLQGITQ